MTKQRTRVPWTGSASFAGSLAVAIALLTGGCREDESALFERRYVLVTVPGFETGDYVKLLDDEDANMRYLALANLLAEGALSEPEETGEAEEPLADLSAKLRELLDDPSPKVRAIAAYAPINRTGDGAEQRLAGRLDDPHAAVRIEALTSLGAGRESRGELSAAATDRVAGLLDHGNVLVRLHALETLASACGARRAGPVVRKISATLAGLETPVLLKALEAIGRIDAEESDTALLGRLDDDDDRIVKVAARGLIDRNPEALEAWILSSLQDARGQEEFLIAVLSEVATARSRDAAASRLAHPNPEIRSGCRSVLTRIGDRQSLDALTGAVNRMIPAVETALESASIQAPPEEQELVAALAELTELGKRLKIYQIDRDGLRTLLQSTNSHEQLVAMASLRDEECFDGTRLEDQPTGGRLIHRLETLTRDRSPVMRAMACEALGRSMRPEAGEILKVGVADPVFRVRLHALDALIHQATISGRRSSFWAVHGRREEFNPDTYAEDDPGWILRQRIEQAARQLEPSWDSDGRAERELGDDRPEVVRLLAASHLVPRGIAVEALLGILATGSPGARIQALQSVSGHLQPKHLDQLRKIAAGETNPETRQLLADLIAGLEQNPD